MPRKSLKPFSIAGVLDYCPECGATGDYALLKKRAKAVVAAWEASGRCPDTSSDRARLDANIRALDEAIDKEQA